MRHHLRITYANDAAADAIAGVAGRLLRFEIVGLGMHDDRSADDRVAAVERNHIVDSLVGRMALAVGFDVS